MNNDTSEVITVREACKALGVINQTIYKLIAEGRLRAFRITNQRWRIYKRSLDEYMGSFSETAFERLLKEAFAEDEDSYIQVLDLRYKQMMDRMAVSNRLEVTEEKVHRWTVAALTALIPVIQNKLSYDDVKTDPFALRVIAEIFLAKRG